LIKFQIQGSNNITKVELGPDSTIKEVLELVSKDYKVSDSRLIIIKDGTELTNEENTLSSYNIKSGDTLAVKHKLHRRWTLWYDTPNPNKRPGATTNWHENIKQVVTFGTVEDFWGLFNNLMSPSKLRERSNYYLFKEGIMPAWEDPQNGKGGSWVVHFTTSASGKNTLDETWLYTILEMIGEGFENADEICGTIISVRKSHNRISLWTKTAEDAEAQKSIGKHFKEGMNLIRYKMSFTSHASATQRGAKPLYEL